MAITVSATTTNSFDDIVLKVWVITGGTTTGTVTPVISGAFQSPTFSLTPTNTGSLILVGAYNANNDSVAITPNANNTVNDSGTTTAHTNTYWEGHWTGTVTGGTPITTLGGTDSASWNAWIGMEIKNVTTAAIDASTPVAAHALTPVTSASFTPPAGALLIAFLLTETSAVGVVGVSDTGSHTWVQTGTTFSTGFEGTAAVFTTTIPSGTKQQPVGTPSMQDALGGNILALGQAILRSSVW